MWLLKVKNPKIKVQNKVMLKQMTRGPCVHVMQGFPPVWGIGGTPPTVSIEMFAKKWPKMQ